MNVKNNKRRQASIEKIKCAFFELLSKKDLQNIKVSELCELANINRSTFYANYLDIYDLADKTMVDLKDKVDLLFDLKNDLNECSTEFIELFNHIKNNQSLYLSYFKLGYDTRSLGLKSFSNARSSYDDAFINYRIAFFKNGFNAIVKLWLENGCRESPQQMCDILLREYHGRF